MTEQIRNDMKYIPTHQWAKIEGDMATVGITAYAAKALGEALWIELPAIGASVKRGESLGEIESVKTAADITSPVSGEIIEVNSSLEDDPALCGRDPYGKGWIAKIRLTEPPSGLLGADEYEKLANKQTR
ncbi:MAG: glycine cleavage system protein GcvH [Desulfovibrio sp.]|nr:glycine cleavage system protein GcvH [Desulfovibrio sp.]